MKTYRLFACLALFALASLAFGCSKDEGGQGESAAEQEASDEAAPGGDEVAAEEPTPAEGGDEPVAKERAADGSGEGDPAARLAGPDKGGRDLVAIGANKTKVVELANKTLSETDEYVLRLELPDDVKKGDEGTVKVKLSPKKGWKLNKEFPTKLEVQPPSGVEVAKKSQGVDDAVSFSEKKGAVWKVDFKSSSAGNKKFGGKFKFAVCTETTCDPKREKLAFAVEVE